MVDVNRVSVQDRLSEVEHAPQPQVAYLFEESVASPQNSQSALEHQDDIFVFQYWPETISDNYSPNYNEATIPGGSHPLYQYVGGGERRISFQARFTAEVKVTRSEDIGILSGTGSDKYSVDIVAAIARLTQYLYPTYREGGQLGVVEAPPQLILVFPNSNIGRDGDSLRVILRDAPVEVTHWFPDGTPRAANIGMEFSESVQNRSEGRRSRVNFVGRKRYTRAAKRYRVSLPNSNAHVTHGGH